MKKRMIVSTIIFTFFLLLMTPQISQAEDTKQIDIGTEPNEYLFNLSNLKPGDQASRILTIQNRGQRDFTYYTKAEFKGGDEKLYNEFLLKISDSNGILHQGKLKDFKSLAPRFLKSMNEEDLKFELEFPFELGNEFQGLGFEVEFIFTVEDMDPPPPPDDPDDPDDPDSPDDPDYPEDPEDPEDPNKPDKPNNPETPEDPDNPTNPQEPSKSTEPQDPDKINPQHPIDPEKLNSPPVDGQILPSTSTNIFNFVLGGSGLIVVGGILFFLQRKRKKITYQ